MSHLIYFRCTAENKAAEKRAVETLRQESEELKKTISDLNLQREKMVQEVNYSLYFYIRSELTARKDGTGGIFKFILLYPI